MSTGAAHEGAQRRRDPVAALLDPESVAIVGASSNPRKRGYQTLRRLLIDGFPHPIYPVNPREDEILGLMSFPSLEAIEAPVDLAFIVTPASSVPGVIEDCGRKGVGAAVVVAVGFGETGEQGRELEREVVRVAHEHGVALVGPNTNGVFNLPAQLNLVGTSDVPPGSLALVCQSGNVGLSLVTQTTHDTELGFSVYAGIGNEAGVRYDQVLTYLAGDDDTSAAMVYAEGFRDGHAFLRAASHFSDTKPIVVYKAGRSEAARRSVQSHTGAVAGQHAVVASVLRQAGVVVVERTDELVPVCETLLEQPALRSPRVAILADGGGHATVAADALSRYSIELPELAPRTRERLAAILPPVASTRNPVDVAGATDGDPRIFDACAEVILEDPSVDGVLCVGLLGGYGIRFSGDLVEAEELAAQRMAELAAAAGKPLVVQSTYVAARPWTHQLLRHAGVPVHESVETAARCIAALWERGRALATREDRSTFEAADRPRDPAATRVLTEPEGRRLLESRDVAVGRWMLVTSSDEAARTAELFAGPVAMKIVSPEIIHKSDVGGVVLDVLGADAARAAFGALVARVSDAVPDAQLDGVLVTPMAPSGVELIVGATTDPVFGPVLTVGAGGTAVELHADVALRAVPVTRREASEMLDELAIAPLLGGFRGAEPVDRDSLLELVLSVSRLVAETPEVSELDLNPVIAHPDGVFPADVRVIVALPEGEHDVPAADADREPATAVRTSG